MNEQLRKAQNIRDAILKFRCVELRECLQVINVPVKNMRKAEMLSHILRFVDDPMSRVRTSYHQFVLKVFDCEQRLKIKEDRRPKRKKIPVTVRRTSPGQGLQQPSQKSIFFEVIKDLATKIIKSQDVIEFDIPLHCLRLLHKKSSPRSKTTYEVQLLFESQENEKWENIDVRYKLNLDYYEEIRQAPPIIYLPKKHLKRHSFRNSVYLKIPVTDKPFNVSVSFVKRYKPSEVLKQNIYFIREVNKTEELVENHFEATGLRVYEVSIICPIEKKVMQYPCRSSLCFHPDVFDLESFLNEAQYYIKWYCPICRIHIISSLDSLELETYFKDEKLEGKINFTFYKKATIPPPCADDPELAIVEDLVKIED